MKIWQLVLMSVVVVVAVGVCLWWLSAPTWAIFLGVVLTYGMCDISSSILYFNTRR